MPTQHRGSEAGKPRSGPPLNSGEPPATAKQAGAAVAVSSRSQKPTNIGETPATAAKPTSASATAKVTLSANATEEEREAASTRNAGAGVPFLSPDIVTRATKGRAVDLRKKLPQSPSEDPEGESSKKKPPPFNLGEEPDDVDETIVEQNHRGPRGLPNNSTNACYMNAHMQCLAAIPHLTKYIASTGFLRDIVLTKFHENGQVAEGNRDSLPTYWPFGDKYQQRRTNTDQNSINESRLRALGGTNGELPVLFRKCILAMKRHDAPIQYLELALKALRSCLGFYDPDYNDEEQKDSAELGTFVHNSLHEDMNSAYEVSVKPNLEQGYRFKKVGETIEEASRRVLEADLSHDNSKLDRSFSAQIANTLSREPTDGFPSQTLSIQFEKSGRLTLELPALEGTEDTEDGMRLVNDGGQHLGRYSVLDLLGRHMAPETVLWGPDEEAVTKSKSFTILPQVLLIDIKRFDYRNLGRENHESVKLKHLVDIPKTMNISAYVSPELNSNSVVTDFVLCATKYHVNGESPKSGHYVSSVRHEDGRLYGCDDMDVRLLDESRLESDDYFRRNSYQLFYVRKDMMSSDYESDADGVNEAGGAAVSSLLSQKFDELANQEDDNQNIQSHLELFHDDQPSEQQDVGNQRPQKPWRAMTREDKTSQACSRQSSRALRQRREEGQRRVDDFIDRLRQDDDGSDDDSDVDYSLLRGENGGARQVYPPIAPTEVVNIEQSNLDQDVYEDGGDEHDPLTLLEGERLEARFRHSESMIKKDLKQITAWGPDFDEYKNLVDLNRMAYVRGGDFRLKVKLSETGYGAVVAEDDDFFYVAYLSRAELVCIAKIDKITTAKYWVYKRESVDILVECYALSEVEPFEANLVNAFLDETGGTACTYNTNSEYYGRAVSLDDLLQGDGDTASDRMAGTKGRVVTVRGRDFLIAYEKAESEEDDDDDDKFSVFAYPSQVVRRHWIQSRQSTQLDAEVGDGDATRDFSMFTNRDLILDEAGRAATRESVSVHDMEPTYLNDNDTLGQRLSLDLLAKAIEVRMLGDQNEEDGILRDHRLDLEPMPDTKTHDEMQRRIKLIEDLISSDSSSRRTEKYNLHPNYRNGREEIYPLSRDSIVAYHGSDLFDKKGYRLGVLEYFVTTRNRLIRFNDKDEPEFIEASPKDGFGYVYITIRNSNKRKTKVKSIYLPRSWAVYWTFTSCTTCAAEDFHEHFKLLDHLNLIRHDDFLLNLFPSDCSDNNKAKGINNRNNSSGLNGVGRSKRNGLWYVGSVDGERIRARYKNMSLASTRRFFEEESRRWRDKYSSNHRLFELLNSENLLHVPAKEVLRCFLQPRDFHRCCFGENQGDNYDQTCLDTGTDIDIPSILDNLNNHSGPMPTLFGDLFIKRIKKDMIGGSVDHLFEALHIAIVSRKLLLPSTTLHQFVFDLQGYVNGHQQSIRTANRMDIETECTDTNFLKFISLPNLPMMGSRLDLTSLLISTDGKYEVLACAHRYNVTIVVWERLNWKEEQGDEGAFRFLAKCKAPEEVRSEITIHLSVDKRFRQPSWAIMRIERPAGKECGDRCYEHNRSC